ncbi:L-serine ammonia-lyase [Frondihabitans australicus]|uniref:L-serine dehydratase n=1 Tax=Frondihabitans australicus TaxID=386892 RepID=A0A495ID48_9MICO|nr:L-serine ammonia-lyase [Frondihabitans australicus]RKR73025.1 L-serine dehydratase [Frondihabitans australicus]
MSTTGSVATRTTDYVSALDLFSVGVGPSSSHTVGPMRAARLFAEGVGRSCGLEAVGRVTVTLFGSLAATGLGHGTPDAVIAGLQGLAPETCDPDEVRGALARAQGAGSVSLLGAHPLAWGDDDLTLAPLTRLPQHPNALQLSAVDESGRVLARETYFSVGGGFVVREGDDDRALPAQEAPLGFATAAELLALCAARGESIAEIAWANECALHGSDAVAAGLEQRWRAMEGCIDAGLSATGVLPGWMKVPRRAASVAAALRAEPALPDAPAQWLQAFALAVNEENAGGGRVVTAPTNGAAGIIPAVGRYAIEFAGVPRARVVRDYLLTSAVVGSLYKRNASISGAEAGCQGEVGSASSMAAAGLTAILGGTPRQVENAAEIAMEHHLGLTCDPVGGFVQVPCIERNAIAAGTAVAATRLALLGDGSHFVSLDTVVETMRQTGRDMASSYKETSEAGLAVNVIEC